MAARPRKGSAVVVSVNQFEPDAHVPWRRWMPRFREAALPWSLVRLRLARGVWMLRGWSRRAQVLAKTL